MMFNMAVLIGEGQMFMKTLLFYLKDSGLSDSFQGRLGNHKAVSSSSFAKISQEMNKTVKRLH